MFEIYSLFLSAAAQHKKRKDSHQHTNPLVKIQSLTKDH